MTKKLAIIGSVGIPAKYGGFETLAEFLSLHLGDKYRTTVYCSSPQYKNNKLKSYNNCKLVYIPLQANGIQSIPYDILSIIHAFFNSNILLILGVAGSFTFPFIRILFKKKIVVNIDGLEHRRDKWNKIARWYLKFAESIAVKFAHVVIADNKGIKEYVKETYNKTAVVIPYGGDHITARKLQLKTKQKYNLPSEYAFKVCRIEPENNIHIILKAFKQSNKNLVIVGNWDNSPYGRELHKTYSTLPNILLLKPIYNQEILNEIRTNCAFYIHGHSAGGTNPSLVEAMFMKKPIIAFNINYNRYTTNEHALFFNNAEELEALINKNSLIEEAQENTINAKKYAQQNYVWELIAKSYMDIF